MCHRCQGLNLCLIDALLHLLLLIHTHRHRWADLVYHLQRPYPQPYFTNSDSAQMRKKKNLTLLLFVIYLKWSNCFCLYSFNDTIHWISCLDIICHCYSGILYQQRKRGSNIPLDNSYKRSFGI